MRCPACTYSYGPREGSPESFDGVFTKDVVCPECAFVVPEGSRVVVGSAFAYIVGARASFSMLFAGGVILLVVVMVAGLPGLIRGLGGGAAGGGGWSATLLLLGALVMLGLLALSGSNARKARKRQSAGADVQRPEDAMLVARAFLVAPGWLAVFDRSNRQSSLEVIDARLVRSVRVRECAPGENGLKNGLKDGLKAGREVSAWLLPPGAPVAPPVFVRADIGAEFAAALDSTLRAAPRIDLSREATEWMKSTAAPVRRVWIRTPTDASGLDADGRRPAAFAVLDGGRAVVLRGSPKDPAEIPYEGHSRVFLLLALLPLAGLLVVLGFMLVRSPAPWPVALFSLTCAGTPVLLFSTVWPLRKRRACAAVVEWYITKNGIEIVRGRSRERRPAAAVEAIELRRPSGVPQLVIAGDRSLVGNHKLIPHNWGGRSPEAVVKQIRAVLRPEVPGIGEPAHPAQ